MASRNKAAETIQYGFKRVSPENLTQLDDKSPHLFRRSNKDWARACLKPQLEPQVPEEVAFLYEVARGSMVYGMFFQPLASLATEQCYRVLEAGARHRCKQLGLLKRRRGKVKVVPDTPFVGLVVALKEAGKLPGGDLQSWEAMPYLRNLYSHPKSQIIQSAQSPLKVVAYTAGLLNRLFK